MSDAPVLVTVDGAVATVTLNRPERLNAMDSAAHLALSDALDRIAEDVAIRVLVLTGKGERAFSAGRDLKELAAGDDPAVAERWRRIRRLTDRLDYPKPIIARVNGLALGGGFELALACDVIVAADSASFALPEPRRGLIPFAGGVHRLPRQLPLKVATGMLLTGRAITASEALAHGLVNQVVAAAELDDAVSAWAADMIACAPLSIAAIKQILAQGLGRPLGDALAATYPAEMKRQGSNDSLEGPRAFAEKREPVWTGA